MRLSINFIDYTRQRTKYDLCSTGIPLALLTNAVFNAKIVAFYIKCIFKWISVKRLSHFPPILNSNSKINFYLTFVKMTLLPLISRNPYNP